MAWQAFAVLKHGGLLNLPGQVPGDDADRDQHVDQFLILGFPVGVDVEIQLKNLLSLAM